MHTRYPFAEHVARKLSPCAGVDTFVGAYVSALGRSPCKAEVAAGMGALAAVPAAPDWSREGSGPVLLTMGELLS